MFICHVHFIDLSKDIGTNQKVRSLLALSKSGFLVVQRNWDIAQIHHQEAPPGSLAEAILSQINDNRLENNVFLNQC